MLTLSLVAFRDSNRSRAARQKTVESPEQDEVDGAKERHDHVHGQNATNRTTGETRGGLLGGKYYHAISVEIDPRWCLIWDGIPGDSCKVVTTRPPSKRRRAFLIPIIILLSPSLY
jgi:hypothetical protein